MTHRKEERIHSKVQENNISSSKCVVNRSTVSQKNTNSKFTNKAKEHEEIVQALKFDTQNSSFNGQVIRELTNND